MTDGKNIRQVEKADVQWMGFIFYPPSPRYIRQKPDYLPETAGRVGVFVNAATEDILRTAREWGLQLIQLHGKEEPEQCGELRKKGLKVIKAFAVKAPETLHDIHRYEGCCDFFLFDTPCTGYGGSGQAFDWRLLETYRGGTPFLLSGGLNPESVRALSGFAHPQWAGIDLNSGFELSPGIKNAEALTKFIGEFRQLIKQRSA